MKVAVIAPTRIPSRKANTLQVMKMSQAIARLGHQIYLIIPGEIGLSVEEDRTWETLARHYGLSTRFPITWLPARKELRKYDYAWSSVRWASNWGADVIYTRLPQAAALAAYQGLAVIFEVHDRPQGAIGPFLLSVFLRGSGDRRLIVISESLAGDLRTDFQFPRGSQIMRVLPDGVDLQRFDHLPSPETCRKLIKTALLEQGSEIGSQFSPELFTVGYTGHLYPGRGISVILEIAAHLPDCNFLIVGGEPGEVRNLQEQVRDRTLDNVIISGFVPNAELPHYQAACDVLLMPYQSRVSGSSGGDIGRYLSPMKLFEYLACGRAICSSNLPVLQEILSPETAILLPPDDPQQWVTAVETLRNNPELRNEMAEKARETARQYTWEGRAEQILNGIEPAGRLSNAKNHLMESNEQ
jgi:glycosyltransferase involved in cell wall biosynthesis